MMGVQRFNGGGNYQNRGGNYQRNSGQNFGGRTGQQAEEQEVHRNINEENYVDEAEKVIKALIERRDRHGNPEKIVSTSKLRNLLSMSSDIYNEVLERKDDLLPKAIAAKISYMRVRLYYESGRTGGEGVKALLNEAGAFEQIKKVGGSREKFLLFHRYLESLVAFRKYYGGKDD